MRVPIQNLSPSESAALSRTTRWRAQQRGWVCVGYHDKNWSTCDQFFDPLEAYAVAERAVRKVVRAYGLPEAHGFEDLLQIAVIGIWRKAEKLKESEKKGVSREAILFRECFHEILGVYRKKREFRLPEAAETFLPSPASPDQGDEQWVEAMMDFVRSSLPKREAGWIEDCLSSNKKLSDYLRHKLHKIFNVSNCAECTDGQPVRPAFGANS